MKEMKLKDIAKAIGAQTELDVEISEISTDSRNIIKGCLFIAIKGENFDGHDYAADALEKGAAAVVVHKPMDDRRALTVKDTSQALLDIAGYYRSLFDVKICAITGSVGKTTTKEFAQLALSAKYCTHKTEKNYNNAVGVPKTLFQLDDSFDAAVIDMGMSEKGEIAPLSIAARPDVAIITNIGVAHIQNLGSRENIMLEKLDIVKGMKKGSTLLLCGDNDMLLKAFAEGYDVVYYGIENEICRFCAVDIVESGSTSEFNIAFDDLKVPCKLPTIGRHNIANAVGAFAAAVTLGVEPYAAAAKLWEYVPSGMRQRIVTKGDVTVVEDCYNASPDSTRSAISTLASMKSNRRLLVLGDMLELGDISMLEHYRIGKLAASAGIDRLYFVGELAVNYYEGVPGESRGHSAFYFKEKAELAEKLKKDIKSGDTVWFKASRGVKLEEVISMVLGE